MDDDILHLEWRYKLMANYANIPWNRINDYIAELGSAANPNEFARLSLQNVGRIIDFDANGMFVKVDHFGKVRSWDSIVEYGSWVKLFNDYYWQTMPDVAGQDMIATNWNRYPDSEFAIDFLKPQEIQYSLGVFRLGTKNEAAAFTLHRTKNSRPFNETDQAICTILQPHLANLTSLIYKIDQLNLASSPSVEWIRDCKLLTKRETEVALLLCQRLTAPEIATKLLISRRTAEFHIANIYQKLEAKSRKELVLKLFGERYPTEDGHNDPRFYKN
jgi:DNA-binding CsgD family transcriptional regulator